MNINDNNGSELDIKSDMPKQISSDVKDEGKRKHTLVIILGIIILLLTNVVSYIFGFNFAPYSLGGIRSLSEDANDYRKIFLVKDVLQKTYNGEIDSELLVDEAIKGMFDSLGDPYTVYMNKKEFEEFNLRSKGEYVGIGIQVAYKDDKVVVVSVFDDSPAYKAGIYPGDIIANVSGEDIDNIDKAISLIKGEELTTVSLVIDRNGEKINFDITREKITILPVEYEKLDEKIGYIKINSFDENSAKGVREALENLKSEGLIIDLRGNPGGLLNECVDIVSEFLPEGSVIVSTDDKYGRSEVIKAKKGIAEDVHVVVLGNASSASASEVFIGALRDHGRSTFVGEKTFGKGLVQRVFEIGDGSGFKVTVSKYYTPNGEYINEIGIKPDIEIDYTQDEYVKNREGAKGDKELLKKLDPQYQKALQIIKEKVYS